MSDETETEEEPGLVDDNGNPRSPTNADLLAAIAALEEKVDYLTGLVDSGGGCQYRDSY